MENDAAGICTATTSGENHDASIACDQNFAAWQAMLKSSRSYLPGSSILCSARALPPRSAARCGSGSPSASSLPISRSHA